MSHPFHRDEEQDSRTTKAASALSYNQKRTVDSPDSISEIRIENDDC